MYDATSLLANAVAQGKPFIFAAVNYRVAGFGFLPGKEILADGAANLGHLDQRSVLLCSFDPTPTCSIAATNNHTMASAKALY